MLTRNSAPATESRIPSSSMGSRRSRRKIRATSAVTAGVVVAMRVALLTVESCRPVNWAILLSATPVMPMSSRAGIRRSGGRSGSPRQRMNAKKVMLMSR